MKKIRRSVWCVMCGHRAVPDSVMTCWPLGRCEDCEHEKN